MSAGSELSLPQDYEESALYVVSGTVHVDGHQLAAGTLAVTRHGASVGLSASDESHVMIIGGANLGERHVWWNFVASSKQRIETAKQDWQANRFDAVPGDDEFIPLPT